MNCDPVEVAVVIPCHNEVNSLPNLVAEISRVFFGDSRWSVTLIIVDDGSSDGTWKLVQPASENLHHIRIQGLRLVGHPGKALAQALGIREASDGSMVVFMDGDGQHAPSDLPGMLSQSLVSGLPVVSWRMDYKRRVTSRIGVGALRLCSSLLGVDFDPRESEFVALPAPIAGAIRADAQLGVLPLLAIVHARSKVTHFRVDIRPRLGDTQTVRWRVGDLWRKGLLHLLSDPWSSLPRIATACVVAVLGMLSYGLWVGIQSIMAGTFLGVASIIVFLSLMFAALTALAFVTLGLLVTQFQARAIWSSHGWITEKFDSSEGSRS